MDERRQLPRWEIKKEAKVWLQQNQNFSFCTIEDMHLKGMCISTKKRLHAPSPVKLSFAINDFDFIKVEAEIPWKKEEEGRFVYGLSFSKVTDENRDMIYQYLNRNCYEQMKSKWWA